MPAREPRIAPAKLPALGLASVLLACASLAPHGALAQDKPSGQPAIGPAGGGDAPRNADALRKAPDAPVGEIVVTAQKREQRLADVPLKVTAVSGAELLKQAVSNLGQLQYIAPELVFTNGPAPSFAVRGIGTQTFSRSASSDVALVIDGVIQSQPIPSTSALFDIQRVEVLSGPQGMLFGKNASAGVINVVSNAPDPRAFSASAHADLGENDYRVIQAVANMPITEDQALRVSLFNNAYGSTLHNDNGDRDVNQFSSYGARASYLWNAHAFKLNVIADYEKDWGNIPAWTSRAAGSLAAPLAACGVTPSTTNTDVCLDGPNSRRLENYGISAQIDVPIGAFTLTSITADRQYDRNENGDSDTINRNLLNLNSTQEVFNQFTQELRLTSPATGPLQYVAGVYFYNAHYKSGQVQAGTLGLAPVPILLDDLYDHNQQISYAAFGQGTLNIYKGLNLVFGARETVDVLGVGDTYVCDRSFGLCVPGVTAANTASIHTNTDNFSYRIGGQYKIDRTSEVYLTYTRGYKGPAANVPTAAGGVPNIVNEETPLYLEAGYKADFFRRRLSVDLVAFHDIVRNFQAQVYDQTVTPAVFRFANASRLISNGVQLDLTARPLPGLTLNGGFLYNRAVYGDFLTACIPTYCTGVRNARGDQLAGAPRWGATLGGEYDHRLTDRFDAYINADAAYRGDTNSLTLPSPNTLIKEHTIVNGRFGVRTSDSKYGIAVFARNLFDTRFPSIIFSDPVSGGRNFDQYFSIDAFRTIGVSLDVKY